jgi:hypothetical protein
MGERAAVGDAEGVDLFVDGLRGGAHVEFEEPGPKDWSNELSVREIWSSTNLPVENREDAAASDTGSSPSRWLARRLPAKAESS